MGGPHLPCQPAGDPGGDRVGSEIERRGAGAVYPPLRKIRILMPFSWGLCKLMRTRYLSCGLLFTLHPNSLCINNGNFSSVPKQASGLKIIFRNFRNVSNPSLW